MTLLPALAARLAVRDGSPADPEHPLLQRYVGGQRLCFADSDPALQATVVIENTDPQPADHPRSRSKLPQRARIVLLHTESAGTGFGGNVVERCDVIPV